jgi:hypothetical protein
MPAPVTVWAVDLVPGVVAEEVRGSLALASDALVFTPKDERVAERRYPLGRVLRARRLRGSPVLMLQVGDEAGTRRIAFYFVQPPPLERPDAARPTLLGVRPLTRRKVRRDNVNYLGMWNKEKKALLREWERQVRTAVAASRRPGP